MSVDTLLDAVDHEAAYALAFCDGGYTTNVPIEDLTGGKAWVAYGYDGEPLDPEHGGPARLLVPHLYFWKSAKWVRGLRLLDEDEPGFWETERLPPLRRPVARAAVLGRLTTGWLPAEAIETRQETPRVRTLVLDVPRLAGPPRGPAPRRPADGGGRLPGAAELLDRVSAGRAAGDHGRGARRRRGLARTWPRSSEPGDRIEVRGPIGGWFVWGPDDGGPLLLVGGGSGVVPLMAMARHRAAVRERRADAIAASRRAPGRT